MDIVTLGPHAAPILPNGTKVILVLAADNDHIERIAELVSRAARRRCWIRTLPCDKAFIETALLSKAADGGSDPRLDSCPTGQVYKVTARLLEFWD
jgi:hypothetical protein